MAKKKIPLACEICKQRNYSTVKSIEERLSINKFCRKCRVHTLHKEEK